jgi:hypothetical protein
LPPSRDRHRHKPFSKIADHPVDTARPVDPEDQGPRTAAPPSPCLYESLHRSPPLVAKPHELMHRPCLSRDMHRFAQLRRAAECWDTQKVGHRGDRCGACASTRGR